MAKVADQIRASDISFWGVLTLVIWALALLGGGVGGMMPAGFLSGLHSSRLEGATLDQLRSQVATLVTASAELRQQNTVLLQRFALNETATGETTRRVGALELSVPKLIEATNSAGNSDTGSVTASTTTTPTTSFDVPGGSVSYTTTPLDGRAVAKAAPTVQPMPQELVGVQPDSSAFGIALGPPIDENEGESTWQSLNAKVGALLLGLGPLLAPVEGGAGKHLVVGPLSSEADARQLCGRMAKVGIACASVAFIGDPLPLLN